MKIAILVREETMLRCSGGGCLSAFFGREDSFARYAGCEQLELVAFTHAGGDIDKKIETLRQKGVQSVHLSSCLRGKDPGYEALAQRLSEYFDVIGYTHGEENSAKKQAVILSRKV